jgi:hypothetical protein
VFPGAPERSRALPELRRSHRGKSPEVIEGGGPRCGSPAIRALSVAKPTWGQGLRVVESLRTTTKVDRGKSPRKLIRATPKARGLSWEVHDREAASGRAHPARAVLPLFGAESGSEGRISRRRT